MICSGIDVETGRFLEIEFDRNTRTVRPSSGGPVGQRYLSAGFIDLQVNGFAGVDFNDPATSAEEIGRAVDAILATGVTRFLPTVITGPPEHMSASLANLRHAQQVLPRGRAIAGFHVEGPHIGADDGPRGAHPAQWVRPPDIDEFKRWQEVTGGQIRIVTLSPHWPEAPQYIAGLHRERVVASIGHTGATALQIAAAVDAGATLSTHLGNAAHAVLRRHPNYLWDQLAEDRLSASFIMDGIHLGQAFSRVAIRAKGLDRIILVTDAAAPAGATPGPYRLGELNVELTSDDRVVLQGTEKLAGSALKMNRAIANLIGTGGFSLRDAIQTATTNPARLIHLEAHPGDLVVFENAVPLRIEAVYLDGDCVAGQFCRGDVPGIL